VSNIDKHGLWLYVRGREYFLPYEEFPWFREAKVCDILDVVLLHEEHLHWPALDVDLCVASLRDPNEFPLVYE
jgi:hypothetical protein